MSDTSDFAKQFEELNAQHLTEKHFEKFARGLLRRLAGNGGLDRVLIDLFACVRIARTYRDQVDLDCFKQVLTRFHDKLNPAPKSSSLLQEDKLGIVHAALRPAAEITAVTRGNARSSTACEIRLIHSSFFNTPLNRRI